MVRGGKMKINDIINEADGLTRSDVMLMFADDPKQLSYVLTAYQKPHVKDWGAAVDVGSADYAKAQRRASDQSNKRRKSDTTTSTTPQTSQPPRPDTSRSKKSRTKPKKKGSFYDPKQLGDTDNTSFLQKAKAQFARGRDAGRKIASIDAPEW